MISAERRSTRTLLIFALVGLVPAAGQTPLVRLVNLSQPLSGDFQIGDRFAIQISGAPRQPISVRTVRQGTTDWGPVVASTDDMGRWSSTGQFEKSDFGDWSEVWTVGDKLAAPAIQLSVNAPCLPGGRSMSFVSGPNMSLTCETAEGSQSFTTRSFSDFIHTPDSRSVVRRDPRNQTVEQYQMGILTYFITSGKIGILQSSRGNLGDETADLINRLIGVNALNEKETRNVLEVIRAAFQNPETIAPEARQPLRTLIFLRHLIELTDREGLKQQIAETIAYVQAR